MLLLTMPTHNSVRVVYPSLRSMNSSSAIRATGFVSQRRNLVSFGISDGVGQHARDVAMALEPKGQSFCGLPTVLAVQLRG